MDTHGARDQWMCSFVYAIDNTTQPAIKRAPMIFREVYVAEVKVADFRQNDRGKLGTRTATLDREGLKKLRDCWLYRE